MKLLVPGRMLAQNQQSNDTCFVQGQALTPHLSSSILFSPLVAPGKSQEKKKPRTFPE